MSDQQSYLVSPTGASGPRIDVLMRMFDRIAEFEHEVLTGKRIVKEPLPILNTQKAGTTHETKNATPRRKRSRLAK